MEFFTFQFLFKKTKDHKKFVVFVGVELTLPMPASACLNLQSVPVPADSPGIRRHQDAGTGCCSAVQHSRHLRIQCICCTGGSHGPLTPVSLGNHSHEHCLQLLWAVDGRRLITLLPHKEKTSYLLQSSPLLHMLLSTVRKVASRSL